ncbi:MAG: hypothetical protein BGO40_03515 [Chryseobacterium sp. 39-10]|nr:MAG: hypothetical protein BGO40_03515 [Chryseobacterium sp. 39-10]
MKNVIWIKPNTFLYTLFDENTCSINISSEDQIIKYGTMLALSNIIECKGKQIFRISLNNSYFYADESDIAKNFNSYINYDNFLNLEENELKNHEEEAKKKSEILGLLYLNNFYELSKKKANEINSIELNSLIFQTKLYKVIE